MNMQNEQGIEQSNQSDHTSRNVAVTANHIYQQHKDENWTDGQVQDKNSWTLNHGQVLAEAGKLTGKYKKWYHLEFFNIFFYPDNIKEQECLLTSVVLTC